MLNENVFFNCSGKCLVSRRIEWRAWKLMEKIQSVINHHFLIRGKKRQTSKHLFNRIPHSINSQRSKCVYNNTQINLLSRYDEIAEKKPQKKTGSSAKDEAKKMEDVLKSYDDNAKKWAFKEKYIARSNDDSLEHLNIIAICIKLVTFANLSLHNFTQIILFPLTGVKGLANWMAIR